MFKIINKNKLSVGLFNLLHFFGDMQKYGAFLLAPGAFFGDLIMCAPGQKGGHKDILTSYCLMKSAFYQWVWLLLLINHVLTTLPAYLREILEGKRLNKLLHKGVKMDNMAKFLTDHPNWYTSYEASSFFLCQVLAASSSVIQVLSMNYYLGNDILGLFPPMDVFMSEQS